MNRRPPGGVGQFPRGAKAVPDRRGEDRARRASPAFEKILARRGQNPSPEALTSGPALKDTAGSKPTLRWPPSPDDMRARSPRPRSLEVDPETARQAALAGIDLALTAGPAAMLNGAAAPDHVGTVRELSSDLSHMLDQVVRAANVARVADRPALAVELDLGRLGGGRVRVQKGDRGLEIRLELDGGRARELATAGLDDLRRGLDARGLEVAALELARPIRGPRAEVDPGTPNRHRPRDESGHRGRGDRDQEPPEEDDP